MDYGMPDLVTQYRSLGASLLGVAITLNYFVVNTVIPAISQLLQPDTWLYKLVIFVVTNGSVYVFVVVGPLVWYERWGWRWFNANVYFRGKWEYRVTYYKPPTETLKKRAADKLAKLLGDLEENHGTLYMKQSLFRLSFQEGTGQLRSGKYTVARARSVKVARDGSVMIHVELNLGGMRFLGIDDLIVKARSKGETGMPLEMSGHFRLISEAEDFVLRGEITYTRVVPQRD